MATEQELIAQLAERLTPREWGQVMIALLKLRGLPVAANWPNIAPLCNELGVDRSTMRDRLLVAIEYERMSPEAKKALDANARREYVRIGGKGGRNKGKGEIPEPGLGFTYTGKPLAVDAHKFRIQDTLKSVPKKKPGPIRKVEKLKEEWKRMHPQVRRSFLQWLHDRGDLVELPTVRDTGSYT